MANVNPPGVRNVVRILQKVRNWLLSHDELKLAHRYEGYVAPRSQPPPSLPPGVAHKLSDNYYCTRDARREVAPPTKVYDAGQALIGAGETPAVKKAVVPGFPYNWETGNFEGVRK